jgi:3-oxoacyl-ACP reductase-like protein
MNDCSNCSKSIEITPTSHVCSTEGKKYVISNYPAQGENCSVLEIVTNKQQTKVKSKDPLISFINNRKKPSVDEAEKKIIEAFDRNMGVPTSKPVSSVESSDQEVNPRNALGWIVAAVLGGVLVASWLLGVV